MQSREDRWILTSCYMCYSHCNVKARRVNGVVAKVTEAIHPEAVAKGKGVHFNTLLPAGLNQVDKLCAGLDTCTRARIYRA